MSDLQFRLLEAHEAPKLVDFILEIYGEAYPNDMMKDIKSVSQAIENKCLISSCAFDGERLVGHLATYYETPDDITGDGITAVVHEDYRGLNLMTQLSQPMWADYEARKLAGLDLYGVTMHDASQRKSLDGGAVVTGLLSHDWPGDFSVDGFAPVNLPRMPIVAMFIPFYRDSMPNRMIYAPERHQAVLSHIYGRIGAPRVFEGTQQPVVATQTESQVTEKPSAQQSVLRIKRIGADAEQVVAAYVSERPDLAVRYIDVALTEPGAAALIEALEAQGWLYGCLLPERLGPDYLRLQDVKPHENWGNTVLDPRVADIQAHITNCV